MSGTVTAESLKAIIRDVPDFPKPGIMFKDITTLLKDGPAFAQVIDLLAERYAGAPISKVIGVEARGFIFAGALAYKLGIGMVPVRKVGKLPAECVKQTYDLEYGTDCVEVHADALEEGEQVLVIDDVIATGGTLAAACELTEKLGAKVYEVAAVVDLEFLKGTERLEGRPFYSLLKF